MALQSRKLEVVVTPGRFAGCVCGVAGLAIGYIQLRRWWNTRYVPADVEALHAACLGAMDACLEEGAVSEEGEELFDALAEEEKELSRNAQYRVARGRAKVKIRRMRAIDKAAIAAKNHFGLVENTEANRRMVGQYVRGWMSEKGMRPSHILEASPMAVVLAICPSRFEVEASQASGSILMRSRLASQVHEWLPSPGSSVRSWMAELMGTDSPVVGSD